MDPFELAEHKLSQERDRNAERQRKARALQAQRIKDGTEATEEFLRRMKAAGLPGAITADVVEYKYRPRSHKTKVTMTGSIVGWALRGRRLSNDPPHDELDTTVDLMLDTNGRLRKYSPSTRHATGPIDRRPYEVEDWWPGELANVWASHCT